MSNYYSITKTYNHTIVGKKCTQSTSDNLRWPVPRQQSERDEDGGVDGAVGTITWYGRKNAHSSISVLQPLPPQPLLYSLHHELA